MLFGYCGIRFWYGLPVDETFWGFDVVLRSGNPEAVQAERVAVRCGWSGFARVIAFLCLFVTADVFAVGAPVSCSSKQMSDDGEL